MVATVRASNRGSGQLLSAGTYSAALPAGWQPGDVVYLWSQVTVAGAANTVSPAGWAAVVPDFVSANSASAHQAVFRRVMQAGDPTPDVAEPACRYAFITAAVRDADTVSPEDVPPVTDTNAGVVFPAARAPSVQPVTANCLLLTGHGVRNAQNGATTTFTPDPAETEVDDVTSAAAGTSNAAIEAASQPLALAGATGTRTATVSVSAGSSIAQCGTAIAVRSAPTVARLTAATGATANIGTGSAAPARATATGPVTALTAAAARTGGPS